MHVFQALDPCQQEEGNEEEEEVGSKNSPGFKALASRTSQSVSKLFLKI